MSRKNDTLRKVGDISQYAGIRHIGILSGRGKGTAVYEAYNASGLCFSVIPDQCLDIFKLTYKGVNFSFISKNGLVANGGFNALDGEFMYYWGAGMLTTCGLENTGPSCSDNEKTQVMHGRIHMQPAENLCAKSEWIEDDYQISIEGDINQSMLWDMHFRLNRKISTSLYAHEIIIRDTIENLEPEAEEFMLLYHFNFGYPLLDEGTRVVKPEGGIEPRDGQATDNWATMAVPDGYGSGEVFFHENKEDQDGFSYIGVINDQLKLGAYLKYSKQSLPILTQWKCHRPHDYVLGLEPGNSYMMGRTAERQNGTLQTIAGYSKQEYIVILGILDGQEEIENFEKMIGQI